MKPKIICTNPKHGVLDFYLIVGRENFFMFEQKYRSGVENYYKYGVIFQGAIDATRARENQALLLTMRRIIPSIRYIEKTEGISVLDQTIRKNADRRAA